MVIALQLGTDGKPRTKSGYRASQNPDGSWNLHDVEIMGTLPPGAKGNALPVDKSWLMDALKICRLHFSERNYLAPIHIKHHFFGNQTMKAGKLMLSEVRDTLYKGKMMPTLIGDLLSIPPDVFGLMENEVIEHRSIEAVKWENREVTSLALLDDDAPYFKFPPLKPASKTSLRADVTLFDAGDDKNSTPAVAMIDYGPGGSVLYCFDGPTHGGPMFTKDPKTGHLVNSDGKFLNPMTGQLQDAAPEGAPPAEGDKVAQALAAVLDGMKAMTGVISKIAEKVGVESDGAVQDADGEKEKKEKEAAAAAAEPPKQKEEEPAQLKALQQQVAEQGAVTRALKDKDTQREATAGIKALFDSAMEKLSDARYVLTADTKAYFQKQSALGKEILDSAVNVYMQNVSPDPTPDVTGATGVAGNPWPKEVLAFQDKGPDQFDKAKQWFRSWQNLTQCGRAEGNLADFLEINVGADTVGIQALLEGEYKVTA